MSERAPIAEQEIEDATMDIIAHTKEEIKKKGCGTFASTHEILGVIAEEYHELVDAVRSNKVADVEEELLDITTACLFAIACINANTIDW
jgi:NTP pyrophosphatase (non-canonical NTP hydrolase)